MLWHLFLIRFISPLIFSTTFSLMSWGRLHWLCTSVSMCTLTICVSYHIATTDRSTLLWRIFSIFNFASRRSSAFTSLSRFRSRSVFLFSRRTGGLCETFAGASPLWSLSASSSAEPAHSFNHVVYSQQKNNVTAYSITCNQSAVCKSVGNIHRCIWKNLQSLGSCTWYTRPLIPMF